MTVYPSNTYSPALAKAQRLMVTRDPDDVHLLALALTLNVSIWSNDPHLAGLPVAAYPTAELLKILSS